MAGTANRSGNYSCAGQDPTAADGPPELPTGISDAAAAKWQELMQQLPLQALRRVDVHELRILSELLAMSDALAAAVAADPTDLKTGRALIQVAQQVHRLSAAFGLNPHDRSRLKLPTEPLPDDFLEWMQGGD